MTDLPTRLRTDAASLDRLAARYRLTGMDRDGAELGERAGLMRAAADEIERLRGALAGGDDRASAPCMLSILRAADASMALGWTDPSHADARRELGSEMCEIWGQIRSALSRVEER